MRSIATLRIVLLSLTAAAISPMVGDESRPISLEDPSRFVLRMVTIAKLNHAGRQALEVADAAPDWPGDGDRVALIPDFDFADGVIDVDVAGDAAPTAPEGSRGFAGVAFRAADEGKRYEYFYFRAKNGRSEDQVRRNHAVQYAAYPDHPWDRLRAAFPDKYECYADVVPREWMHFKIEVKGETAKLYVNGARQPTMIVNDLKLGASKGKLGLWVGPRSVAHFSSLRVTPA
jgi:hypothetical protein